MQYLITVYDYEDNLEKRLKVREEHLIGARKLIDSGNIIKASAIIKNEIMIGSSLFVDFKSEDELNSWLETEAYVVGKVWDMSTFKKVQIKVLDS